MNDPWNPSPSDIREWAYDQECQEPCQDWDLAISWSGHERAILDCAADDHCPKQKYFLHILYLMVGDAVRSDFRTREKVMIEGLIARADQYRHSSIQLWQTRSNHLINNPSEFDYERWCGGGLAKDAEPY